MNARVLLLAAGLGWFDLSGSKHKEPSKLEEIQVEVTAAWQWLPLSGSHALRVRRAVDGAGKPYVTTLPHGCAPEQLRRSLTFDKKSYLLDEPIVIEMRVEAEGSCRWHEPVGGNYRGRGRDDNFLFLVQHAGAGFVADPYGTQAIYIGGGLSSMTEVERGKPFSHWLGVQRWAALEKPGKYHVHAFQYPHEHEVIGMREALQAAIPAKWAGTTELEADSYYLRDRVTKTRVAQMVPTVRDRAVPSPIAATLPRDLRAELGERADSIADYATATIEIRDGTAAERAAMVSTWSKLAEARSESWPAAKSDAAHEAIWFTRGQDFLDTLERWMKSKRQGIPDGLAMNPSPRALSVLLAEPSEQSVYALHRLAPAHVGRAIPTVIDWLDHPNAVVRGTSEQHLRAWTKQDFGRIKAMWRTWWQAHQSTFKP
jgi:hypothetical protein